MNENQASYLRALKYGWLTSLYDPIARVTLRDSTFKRQLIEQAQIQKGQNILDLGCGTATLTLLVKKLHPETQVVGLDADPAVLAIAKAKATKSRLAIDLDLGLSFKLPFPDEYFHRVFSSLMFHHLTPENKRRTLAEVYRVLRPSGELHVADWGKHQNLTMRVAFLMVQMLDGFKTTAENVRGELPEIFRNAGFKEVQETSRSMTMFGTLSLYLAKRPVESNL